HKRQRCRPELAEAGDAGLTGTRVGGCHGGWILRFHHPNLSVSLSSSTHREGKRDALSAAALLLTLLQKDWRSQRPLSPDQHAKLSPAGDREQKKKRERRFFYSSSSNSSSSLVYLEKPYTKRERRR
ncbi:unnamed protein product, partial [Musa acuminata subsp. burmannicoides]